MYRGAHRLHRRRRLRAFHRPRLPPRRCSARSSTPARRHGMKPCGLGARDTLRLEAGLPLYGHELDRATSPLEAGLEHFVKLGREFVGAAASTRSSATDSSEALIGLRTDDGRSIARQGYKLFVDEREVGVVTSGTFAPTLRASDRDGISWPARFGRQRGIQRSKWRFAIAESRRRSCAAVLSPRQAARARMHVQQVID